MFIYPVGGPFWKAAARAGVAVGFRVRIHRDAESGTYWADSPDLDGLIVSGSTLDELRTEARCAAESLFELALHQQPKRAVPKMVFDDAALCAA